MASVTLEHVYKSFGPTKVVQDANLDIEDGDFVVLVGPSGCGKSTTLRMVAGLEEITAGSIKIGPKVVNELSPRDRDVAMVFQSYALYPHMSVKENIAFGLRLRKMDSAEIDRRVNEAAEILGLKDLLNRKPKQLSGGQRQRVAMGRSIVRQPSVFLFDEPLSNLDAKLRVQMRSEIARLHQRLGTTTVYVTHDQVEAMTLAKHIVVMKDGLIQQVGAPLELYRHPVNIFVAGFIGSPSMNFLDCDLLEKDGEPYLHSPHFSFPVPERLRGELGDETELVLGIRPEHFGEPEPGQEGDVPVNVEVLEPLGSEVNVLGNVGGRPVTATLEPTTEVKVGENPQMRVDREHMHLFVRATGLALGL
ncbi:MAG: sn-glycerol-3-phosphate ABC transporter ATP-binding protein UgpC [Myxococcota bacterium]